MSGRETRPFRRVIRRCFQGDVLLRAAEARAVRARLPHRVAHHRRAPWERGENRSHPGAAHAAQPACLPGRGSGRVGCG